MNMYMYYKDAYKKEMKAKVVDCFTDEKGNIKLELDDTCFYPEGGGQPSDIGFINDVNCTYVKEENGKVYHYVDKEFNIDEEVTLKLDFKNRYENMKHHTAEHIISGLIHSTFEADNVGFHMGKDLVTMDFNREISKEELREIENKANQIVSKNIGVVSEIVTPKEAEKFEYRSKKELDGDIRLVNIPGVDLCACCGVHVEKTGEIGMIKLLYSEKYKTGSRVYMICGMKAIDEFNKEYDILERLSEMLSSPFENIYDRVDDLKTEMEYLKIQNRYLKSDLFEVEIKDLNSKDVNVVVKEDVDSNTLKNMIEILDKKEANESVILSRIEDTEEIKYIIKSKTESARSICLALNETFNGKGGGNFKLTQGTIKCKDIEFVINFIKEKVHEED